MAEIIIYNINHNIIFSLISQYIDKHFCYLDFCLIAGCISLVTVIIGIASKIMVEDAWADGM